MRLLELAETVGLNPKRVSETAGGEYHSACPSCGGKDRFIMQPNRQMPNCMGSFWCRRCEIHGDSIAFARVFNKLDFWSAVEAANGTLPSVKKGKRALRYKIVTNKQTSDPNRILIMPNQVWINRAAEIIKKDHLCLLKQSELLRMLEKRGLPIEVIKQYKIGYNPKDVWDDGRLWGHTAKRKQSVERVWRPRGIGIPVWQKDVPIKLKYRRLDYNKSDGKPKYVNINGGMNGLTVIGAITNKTIMVVESELDIYALYYALSSSNATLIAIGGSNKNPDNVSAHIAANASNLFICHDNDEVGRNVLAKWMNMFPHAKATPTPVGKDIGEAIQNGFDVKMWFNNLIIRGDSDHVVDLPTVAKNQNHKHQKLQLENESADCPANLPGEVLGFVETTTKAELLATNPTSNADIIGKSENKNSQQSLFSKAEFRDPQIYYRGR